MKIARAPFLLSTLFITLLMSQTGGCGWFDGPCECDWEGGQYFRLNGAYLDQQVLYLDVTVEGQPCCEDTWTRTRMLRADFAGYSDGDLHAGVVDSDQRSGTTIQGSEDVDLPTDPTLKLELGAVLGLELWSTEPTGRPEISAFEEEVRLFDIVVASYRSVLGQLVVPGGDALR